MKMNFIKKANRMLPFMALAVVAFATSCSSDKLADSDQQTTGSGEAKTVTLTATMEGENAGTRVGMSKGENNTTAKFYWHKGDAIAVLSNSAGSYGKLNFTTEDPTGNTAATFSYVGDAAMPPVGNYAAYPYDNVTFTGEQAATFKLPSEYTYNKVESNIFSKTNGESTTYPENNTYMPMLGTISGGEIAFKHVGGLAVIRVDKMPETTGTLTITATQKLSGDFAIEDISATDAQINTASTNTASEKKVTFTFSGATKDNAGVFYLPLATGDYTSVNIVLKCGTINQTVVYSKLTITRAAVTAIPVVANKVVNGHTFIDLGLPSGLLWSETNLGATSATGSGKYYAWGETSSKSSYSWSSYAYGNSAGVMNKYSSSDGKTVLETTDDAATTLWGSPCRMPTNEEFQEILNNSNCYWKRLYSSYQVTSNRNGNSIYFPASGYQPQGIIDIEEDISNREGYYWSSTRNSTESKANCFYLNTKSYNKYTTSKDRYYGMTIRPVVAK